MSGAIVTNATANGRIGTCLPQRLGSSVTLLSTSCQGKKRATVRGVVTNVINGS